VLANLHELKQLVVGHEAGAQDLTKQRVVVLGIQTDAILNVTHS